MFSVKQFMEEGIKFIIPPPKYHPFPDILPILDPSLLSRKMASESNYHRLPEDNVPRPSMDSIPGDDQRLLDTDPLYDDDSPSPLPKNGMYKFKLSYHPTFYLRLFVLCLFISSFGVFIASRRRNTIVSIIFLSFVIFRNVTVLYSHLVRRSFIRIHIEIVGRTSSVANAKPKKRRPRWLQQRVVQVLIDWILITILTITTAVALTQETSSWYWRPKHTLPACILSWIGLPLYALSTLDMGKPARIQFTKAVSYDTGKEKEDADEAIIPRTYRDVAASGGLGDMTRKTGADSPPMI